jgi:hypothetical protein
MSIQVMSTFYHSLFSLATVVVAPSSPILQSNVGNTVSMMVQGYLLTTAASVDSMVIVLHPL